MTKASTWEFWEGHQHFSYIYLYTYTHSQTHTECQNIGNGHHWSYNLKVHNRFLPLVLYLFLPSKCSVVYFCYLCYFIDIYISSEPSRKPQNTGVVAHPFSRGSSWPRTQTRVYCSAGGWMPVQFLDQEDPLEKGQATHPSILGLPWWLRW